MLALLIHIFHRVFTYFTLFGFLLPKKYLIYHLLCFPGILIHWMTNNNKCILTELEIQLSGKSWSEYESEYSIKLLKSFGINVKKDKNTKDFITKLYITSYTISWLISLIRYIFG